MSPAVERWAGPWRLLAFEVDDVVAREDFTNRLAPVVALVAAAEEWASPAASLDEVTERHNNLRSALRNVLGP